MTLLDHLDTVPPFVVRRLAGLTTRQLARAAGLSESSVKRWSRLRSWSSLPLAQAQALASACGHDLLDPTATLRRLADPKAFTHLKADARRHFARMLKP